MMRCLTFALVMLAWVCEAQIFPAGTTYPWSQDTVGIWSQTNHGGWLISTNRAVYTNVVTAGADPTGVTDCTAIVLACYNACPSNQAVFFPSGTFKIAGNLNLSANNFVTIRGNGAGNTVLNCPDYVNPPSFGVLDNSPDPLNTNNITAGATNGSTNIACTMTANNFAVHRLITICQTNISTVKFVPGFYVTGPTGQGHDSNSLMAVTVMVNQTNASGVSFWPPLPCDMTNGPTVCSWTRNNNAGLGIENMTFNVGAGVGYAMQFNQAEESWMRGCQIINATQRQVWWNNCIADEMSGCITLGTSGGGPNTEGIDLGQNCCFDLIEDNVCISAGFPEIILGDYTGGCVGNVIDYNYVQNCLSGESIAGWSVADNHGPHNMFNLFEGNVMQSFESDGYYGSQCCDTLYRNYIHGVYSPFSGSTNTWPICIAFAHWCISNNVADNVLGSNSFSSAYLETNLNYSATTAAIYALGYPQPGNRGYSSASVNPSSATALDLGVITSITLTNNFDYATGTTVNPNPSYAPAFSASLFYTNGPPGFWGSCPWPAIGPDLAVMTNGNPAEWAYNNSWPCGVAIVGVTSGGVSLVGSPGGVTLKGQ